MGMTPSADGTIPFKIESIEKPCFTYYKVFGDLETAVNLPLICLHGGPGGGHGAQLPFAEIWPRYGIPVILYDQIGCGKSTHLPETVGDRSFWTMDVFVSQLHGLIRHFGLDRGRGFYLMGRSFGGMLAAEFATSRPPGLRRLIIGSGSPGGLHAVQSFNEVIEDMPPEHRQAILDARQAGNFESEAYKAAFKYFVKNYLCRSTGPLPKELEDALRELQDGDTTVLRTVYGPSPFLINGTLLEWDCVPKLHLINVPTLVQNSEFDTNGRDSAQQPFFARIPSVKWVTIAGAGHTPHLENAERREKVVKIVGEFLTSGGQ
ncbi:hypothetical protein ANO11243_095860 [Dothideomycetidae sp. 11243]|nr:hypothetical protein ANO11243_095860 [fungal sp. No.11243]